MTCFRIGFVSAVILTAAISGSYFGFDDTMQRYGNDTDIRGATAQNLILAQGRVVVPRAMPVPPAGGPNVNPSLSLPSLDNPVIAPIPAPATIPPPIILHRPGGCPEGPPCPGEEDTPKEKETPKVD